MAYVDVDGDPATFNSSSAAAQRAGGRDGALRRPLLGRRAGPGRDAAAAVRPDAAAHGPAPPTIRPRPARRCCRLPGGGGYVPVAASVFDTYTEDLGCAARRRRGAHALPGLRRRHLARQARRRRHVHDRQRPGRHGRRPPRRLVARRRLPGRRAAGAQPHGLRRLRAGRRQRTPCRSTSTASRRRSRAPVNTQLGIVSYEGDLTLKGDSLSLNGTTLSDAAHPSGNFFDSAISEPRRARSRAKSPDYRNQLGFDASVLGVPAGVVPNGTSKASIELKTIGDRYLPGVVFFRTDIYAPEMVLKKTVTDVNGGDVEPGRRAALLGQLDEHRASARPTTRASTTRSRRTRRSSRARSRSSSSPGGIAGAKTDPTDADQAEYDGAGQRRCASASAPAPARSASARTTAAA